MIRKLLIVAGSATALAVLSLGGAWLAGGTEIMGHIHKGESFGWHPGFGKHEAGPRITRTLAWKDEAPLVIDAPVELSFTRADSFSMTVSGPERLIKALRFEEGRLFLAPGSRHHHDDDDGLTVEMRGPHLAAINLRSAGRIDLAGLDQPRLKVDADGAADLDATGKVGALEVTAQGVGNLDFSDLKAKDARLRLNGVGNVDLNATGAVDIDVSGIGNVTLHAKPRALTTRSDGIGSIDKAY